MVQLFRNKMFYILIFLSFSFTEKLFAANEHAVNPVTNNELTEILNLEANKEYANAFYKTLSLAQKYYSQAQIGEIVSQIHSKYTKHIKEVIVERISNQSSNSSALSFLNVLSWITHSFSETNSYSESYDITKFIHINTEEEARLPQTIQEDRRHLFKKIDQHIKLHWNDIITLKLLSIKALEFADNENRMTGKKIPIPHIAEIWKIAMNIHFLGEHMVTYCIRTDYSDRSSSKSSTYSYNESASLFDIVNIFNFSFSASSSSKWQQIAHTVQTCDPSSVEIIRVNMGNTLWQINLLQLDQLIIEWMSYLKLSYVVTNMKEPQYSAFGNPYLSP